MQREAQLKIRLPADIKSFIETQSEKHGSSQNSEIIRAIRERMERTKETAPTSVAAPAEA